MLVAKSFRERFSLLFRISYEGAIFVASVALLAFVWYEWPSQIVALFDLNLGIIRLASNILDLLFGEPWGARAESSLRGFSAERGFLLLEVSYVLKGVVYTLGRVFRRKKSAVVAALKKV